MPYFDDILVKSKKGLSLDESLELHRRALDEVCGILAKHSLVANIEKCQVGYYSVMFLGHLVSADGIRADGSKLASVWRLPAPKDKAGLRRMLGLFGYF